MSLKLSPYPQCCKAIVLHGFGAGHASEHGDKFKAHRSTKEEILDFLKKNVRSLQSQAIQTIFACPTNHQPEAIEALQEFGFFDAPAEDLKAVERVQGTAPIRDAAGNVTGYEPLVHQMHPMFYLIPRP